jgi:peptide/nickel transport system permease protein
MSRLLSVWLALTVVFLMMRLLPGDAIRSRLVEIGADSEAIAHQRDITGLNSPIFTQYVVYFTDLLRGEWGLSLSRGIPVSLLIQNALAHSLTLAAGALSTGVTLGCISGVAAALNSARLTSFFTRLIISLTLSTPIYWSGSLAILLFSAGLNWLPASGSGSVEHLVLPVLVSALPVSGAVARILITSIEQTMQADFVRTARAKGLSSRRILLRHVLPTGFAPVIGVIGVQAGFLMSGVVITETLFARAGIGRVLLDAVLRRDYPVVQIIVIFSALTYTLLNLTTDFLQWLLDPRLRHP